MGPTSILPKYHHVDTVSNVDEKQAIENEAPLGDPAGTVALIDFDSWHRGSANTSDQVRYMCKFHYCRAQAPTGDPSWDHKDTVWRIDPVTVHPERMRNQHLWESTWRWMLNDCEGPVAISPVSPSGTISDTTAELLGNLEAAGASASAEGLRAAYHLAQVVQPAGQTVAALDAMLALMRAQAKEMSSVGSFTPHSQHSMPCENSDCKASVYGRTCRSGSLMRSPRSFLFISRLRHSHLWRLEGTTSCRLLQVRGLINPPV